MATKEISIPYNFNPRPYQVEFLESSKRFKVAVWHRRGGKSKTVLNDQIKNTQLRKGIYYYFLPTYRQAKSAIWDDLIKKHLPMEIVDHCNSSELAIYYKNGSIQKFAGCENIDSHRGINPIDVVFDEYSEIEEKMWTTVIQPILRQNGGTASFIFTPKGKNHSWKLLQQAKQNPEQWFWSVKTVDDTKGISEKELAETKKITPQAYYEQEYMCAFNENAGAFFRRIRQNVYHGIERFNPRHEYKLGVDLAKVHDFTVITPLDLMTFKVLPIDRFNQIDWNLQKARIEVAARKFNDAEVTIDSTGVGDPVVEDLENNGLNIRPFKFQEKSKKDLLKNLAMLLEQDKIKIPNDEVLITELESVQMEMGEKGNYKIVVPKNMHDDCVMSLALACWEANKININEKLLNTMDEEVAEDKSESNLYSAI